MNHKYIAAGVLLTLVLVGVVTGVKTKRVAEMKKVQDSPTFSDGKTMGSENAPVKIVEYSDFQCPACVKAQTVLKELENQYPGKIQVTFRHFPLPMHQWSGPAHQAAECANQMGQFWPYQDRLFSQQEKWSKSYNPMESFLTYAKDLGINMDRFAVCLADMEIKRKILLEKAQGEGLKIESTPTFFINGERVVGGIELKTKGEDAIRKILGLPPIARPVTPKPEAPKPPASDSSASKSEAPVQATAAGTVTP